MKYSLPLLKTSHTSLQLCYFLHINPFIAEHPKSTPHIVFNNPFPNYFLMEIIPKSCWMPFPPYFEPILIFFYCLLGLFTNPAAERFSDVLTFVFSILN